MNSHIKTYTYGYDLFFTRNITKGDMVNICNDLTKEFDNKYIFEPEPVCDGFIYIKNEDYKSMRLSCFHAPWVNKTVMEDWKDCKDIFVNKIKRPPGAYPLLLSNRMSRCVWKPKITIELVWFSYTF